MIHHLKTWDEFFEAMWQGNKTFEFRKDDRGFGVGHTLELHEFIPKDGSFTGRWMVFRVDYILREGFGMPEGYVIMSGQVIKRVENDILVEMPTLCPKSSA